jgi:type VI secretion system protein ImpI/type VI secretion system protein
MTLTLSMLRCPETVAPETRSLQSGEFSIGRGPENDWVLADPERSISKQHCMLAYRSGCWQIADLSTNGTFLNRDSEPLGRGQPHDLRDGDRVRIGPYEIEIRIVEAAAQRSAAASQNPFDLDPFANPPAGSPGGRFEQDPLLRPAAAPDAFAAGFGSPGVNLPADYDPLAPEPSDAPFTGPAQADHSPHIEDAFIPAPARSVLPDDWDREFRSFAASAAAPESPPAAPAPAVASPIVAPPGPVPATPPEGMVPPPRAPLPAPAAPSTETAPSVEADLLVAFLRGVGVADLRPSGDPAAAMEALGRAFRALVSGLRRALMARAAVKREFRLEQTMLRSQGNNPLKFSADDEDALRALLGAGRRTEMNAADAVADALRDVRLHELATVVAMQSAVRALLAELDPAKLRRTAERGGLDFVPMQRKAGAWDAFEALHARITHALSDDFDSVFGKNFARAYERALTEVSAKEED